jgi:hypothetical protein
VTLPLRSQRYATQRSEPPATASNPCFLTRNQLTWKPRKLSVSMVIMHQSFGRDKLGGVPDNDVYVKHTKHNISPAAHPENLALVVSIGFGVEMQNLMVRHRLSCDRKKIGTSAVQGMAFKSPLSRRAETGDQWSQAGELERLQRISIHRCLRRHSRIEK